MDDNIKPEGNWHVLVSGIELEDSPLVLAPGLSLRSLDLPLTIFDLANAGAVGFKSWAAIEPFAPSCKSEIISSADAATKPGYDALNRAWLVSNMLNLLGFSQNVCIACSNYSWNLIAGHRERNKIVSFFWH